MFENLKKVIAIELLNAAQAADFRKGKSSEILENLRNDYREKVPFIEDDVVVSDLIHKTIAFLEH